LSCKKSVLTGRLTVFIGMKSKKSSSRRKPGEACTKLRNTETEKFPPEVDQPMAGKEIRGNWVMGYVLRDVCYVLIKEEYVCKTVF